LNGRDSQDLQSRFLPRIGESALGEFVAVARRRIGFYDVRSTTSAGVKTAIERCDVE
jgi:hypothetical protein